MFKRLNESQRSVCNFQVVVKFQIQTLEWLLIFEEQLEQFQLPKYFNELSLTVSTIENVVFHMLFTEIHILNGIT